MHIETVLMHFRALGAARAAVETAQAELFISDQRVRGIPPEETATGLTKLPDNLTDRVEFEFELQRMELNPHLDILGIELGSATIPTAFSREPTPLRVGFHLYEVQRLLDAFSALTPENLDAILLKDLRALVDGLVDEIVLGESRDLPFIVSGENCSHDSYEPVTIQLEKLGLNSLFEELRLFCAAREGRNNATTSLGRYLFIRRNEEEVFDVKSEALLFAKMNFLSAWREAITLLAQLARTPSTQRFANDQLRDLSVRATILSQRCEAVPNVSELFEKFRLQTLSILYPSATSADDEVN